ncbi:MAG: ankyrin repeat domain-containing protein [Alphaproteobacteria bacterium]
MSLIVKFNGQADAYNQLSKAIGEDNGDLVTALIQAGADFRKPGDGNMTLLHIAAETGKPKAMKALLDAGANIHKCDDDGHSVLRYALRAKSLECVELAVQAGADPYNRSFDSKESRETSDNAVSITCDWDIAIAVAKVSDSFFVNEIVRFKNFEDVKGLELRFSLGEVSANTIDRYGKTPLILACENGYAESARILFAHKADANLPDRDGNLPIHVLAKCKNPAMVKVLVDGGARLTARDSRGDTALEIAQRAGNEPMVNALEQAMKDFTASATMAGEGVRAMKTLKIKQPVQA